MKVLLNVYFCILMLLFWLSLISTKWSEIEELSIGYLCRIALEDNIFLSTSLWVVSMILVGWLIKVLQRNSWWGGQSPKNLTEMSNCSVCERRCNYFQPSKRVHHLQLIDQYYWLYELCSGLTPLLFLCLHFPVYEVLNRQSWHSKLSSCPE